MICVSWNDTMNNLNYNGFKMTIKMHYKKGIIEKERLTPPLRQSCTESKCRPTERTILSQWNKVVQKTLYDVAFIWRPMIG
jgi:hypothetical protein